MFLVLAFMYTVCMTIKDLVLDKELRLKEVLRVVGIQNGALWSVTFTENIVLLTVPCALISVMVKVSGKGGIERIDISKHKAYKRNVTHTRVLLLLIRNVPKDHGAARQVQQDQEK